MVSRKSSVGLLPFALYLISASWSTIAIAAEQNPLAVQDGAPAAAAQSGSTQDAPQGAAQAGTQDSGKAPPPDAETGYTKGSGKTAIFSTAAIDKNTIESRGADSTYDAIKNVSGVSFANTKSADFADDLQIRGIHLSSTSSYRLDGGLPIANNSWRPTDDTQTVQVLKGAAALFYGIAAPGGVVNYVTKRPTDEPYTAVSVQLTSYGQVVGALDWSRRFGENDQIGVRINLSATDFQTFVPGVDGAREFGSVAIDWEPSDKLSFKTTFETWNFNVTEQATLALPAAVAVTAGQPLSTASSGNVTATNPGSVWLPKNPDPTKNLAGPNAQYDVTGYNIQEQAEYKLDYGWRLLASVGQSEVIKWERNTEQFQPGLLPCPTSGPMPAGCPGSKTYTSLANILAGNGTMTVTGLRDQDSTNTFVDVEAKNHLQYSFITNNFTFGVARSERAYDDPTNDKQTTALYNGYFYNPNPALLKTNQTGLYVDHPQDSVDYGVYGYDVITLWNRIHLVGGVRHVNYYYNQDPTINVGPNITQNTQISTPSFGAVIDVTKEVSLYASFLRGLEELGSAPQNAANAYQILPPGLAVQKEVGIRVQDLFNTTGSVGYFTINRENAILPYPGGIFAVDGQINYTGLETNVRHNITEEWIVGGAAQWTKALQDSPTDAAINGKYAENTPFFGGNAYLTYKPEYVPGLSVTLSESHIGKREIDPQDLGRLPAVDLLNFGTTYRTVLWDHNWAFNLSGTNLADVRWWSSAYNGNLGVGAPITFRAGAKVEF